MNWTSVPYQTQDD